MPSNNRSNSRPTVVNASQIAAQQNANRAVNENRPAGAQGSAAGPQGVRQPAPVPAPRPVGGQGSRTPIPGTPAISWNPNSGTNDPGTYVRAPQGQAPAPGPEPAAAPFPQFDWEAWNAEMMARQSAVWESMDAMNSAFLEQMTAYRSSQQGQPSRGGMTGVSGSQDAAQVKAKRRTKRAETNTTSSQASPQGSGLNIGNVGGQANGLGIGKQ